MSECEDNNSDSTVTSEVSVGMSTRQMQALLTNVVTTLRTDIVTMIETNDSKFQTVFKSKIKFLTITKHLDSNLQAATENISAKIQQENEELIEQLAQKLHNEVKKLSSDICTL
jgi:hypothetical protein